jgi:hypothetical protein
MEISSFANVKRHSPEYSTYILQIHLYDFAYIIFISRQIRTKNFVGKPEANNQALGVIRRILLQFVELKQDLKLWAELICLKMGSKRWCAPVNMIMNILLP